MPLWLGHVAESAEGACYVATPIVRQVAELLHRTANLLTLGRSETLHSLGVSDNVLALLGGHGVELREAIVHPLLNLRLQVSEARFRGEGVLLLGKGQIPMRLQPLRQMLLG